MSLISLVKEIDKLNNETLPKLDLIIDGNLERFNGRLREDLSQFVAELHGFADRLNGATATITINIPPRKENQ